MRATVLSRICLAAGAALLVALAAASCGPTQALPCNADTCSGCCTADNRCLGKDEQGFQACGSGGKVCVACLPREICSHGACVQDPDAGRIGGACDPSSCSGCCAGETCIELGSQSNQNCGAGGLTCGTCPSGTQCSDGLCVQQSGVDAGTCGKKGAPCCSGGKCFLGLSCVAGVCDIGGSDAGVDAGTKTDGGSGALPVGSPCTANSQCQTGECRIIGFPNGYCTKSCATDSDCPSGSRCGADPNDSTGQSQICLESCSPAGSAATCRPDYVCERRNVSGGGGCLPKCNSPATCGAATQCDSRGFCCGANGYACCNGSSCDTGLSCDSSGYCKPTSPPDAGSVTQQPVGAACTSNTQCASGICVVEDPGGSAGCATGPCFPGGYCIADCTSAPCPSGSSCTPYLNTNPVCLKNCSQPGTTNGCRAGYVCDKNWIPNSSQSICVDACNSAADCNSPDGTLDCVAGFCCGKVSYRCCGGVGGTCPYGGTCGADGYCQ